MPLISGRVSLRPFEQADAEAAEAEAAEQRDFPEVAAGAQRGRAFAHPQQDQEDQGRGAEAHCREPVGIDRLQRRLADRQEGAPDGDHQQHVQRAAAVVPVCLGHRALTGSAGRRQGGAIWPGAPGSATG
jgi:hypothetical protein